MQQQLNNLLGALTQGTTGPQVTPLAFLLLMAVSLLSSMFIAYLYVHFYSNRATGSQVHRAFPLLGISITAIFVTIQFSLPLSRSEEHTSELQSQSNLVCRLLLEKKKKT